MLTDDVLNDLKKINRKTVVLYGIEAQICMRQTALDLIERGYDVHIVIDCCSSMNHHDRHVGI
jgi:nicotinamidase-related amidase